MDIYFNTKKIEKLCKNTGKADTRIGAKCAKILRQRLSQLAAVKTLGEIVYGKPHPLKGDRIGEFSISLEGGFRLVIKPIEPIPKTAKNAIDWKKVSNINIVFIGDYHD